MTAVAKCMEHQSQEATDIRWLKVMYALIVEQNIQFPETMANRIEEWRLYPEVGDQRSVRPSIRAMEINMRAKNPRTNLPFEIPETIAEKASAPWSALFWAECAEKTPCIVGDIVLSEHKDNKHYFEQLFVIYEELAEHFIQNTTNTSVDPRRDACFGLTLYATYMAIELSRNEVESSATGRILLRTIVESYITLRFLAHKDNPTIWQQFRQHGTGQIKLTFLKNLREESVPDFISLNDLYQYANEDIWQEYINMDIKPWSEKNLREMAIETGAKDVYDKHHDWASGYVHGNWGAIRDTIFTVCLNPLHRFHRVPFLPRPNMPSVLRDAAGIVNLMLDITSQFYPPFKNRVKRLAKHECAKPQQE